MSFDYVIGIAGSSTKIFIESSPVKSNITEKLMETADV